MGGYSVNLRNARIKAGLTQKELAERVCVSQSMIAQCENGAKAPTVVLAVRIARTLGTSCEALVEDAGGDLNGHSG